jgi:hypothetical protein
MEQMEQACKFILCVLLTQLGKTFTAINRIITEIEQDAEFGRSIHIVFTMNTLLNNKQFAKRLQTIEDIYGKGSICIFTSKYDGKYIHVKDRLQLQGLCADESTCPRVIVMCSNSRRYDDGVEFLKVIDKNKINIYRAFAYYDELHKYISDTLRSQIEDIHTLDILKGIIALTASPDKIWRSSGFWSKLRLIQLDHFNEANYAGYKDMIFNCVDDFFTHPYIRPKPFSFDELDEHTIGFIQHVLKKFPEIIQENTRSFIPAHVRRSGHNSVRDLIFDINSSAVVIVINGFEKTLQYKDHLQNIKTIPLTSDDEEVCETISRLIMRHGLQKRPVVITGFLCVGMGQTLTHKLLGSFTSAIFGHLDLTNDEIYQLFGRITGRIKDWGDKYVQTQVYCPTTIMHRCHVMEECARNMACDYNGDVVTQKEYREPMHDMGIIGQSAIENIRKVKEKHVKSTTDATSVDIRYYRIYDSESALKGACSILGYKYMRRPTDSDGFKITTLNDKDQRKISLHDAIKKVPSAYGGGGGKRSYYPCYVDTSDITTERFVLIIRPETDESKIEECDRKYPSLTLNDAPKKPKRKMLRYVIESDSDDDRPANGGAGRSDSD